MRIIKEYDPLDSKNYYFYLDDHSDFSIIISHLASIGIRSSIAYEQQSTCIAIDIEYDDFSIVNTVRTLIELYQ